MEHGKTIPDALGDLQRGVEVAEFAVGIPHLLKGEYTDGAGPGIDMYSMRQPVGVAAGITPFNFPAMIPLWKCAPAIACGNAFILKPSERDPSCPMRLAELFLEAGLPPGILNVVNGDKEAVDAILDDPDIAAVGFVGSTPIAQLCLFARHRPRQARAMFRRRQEPHDRDARCRHGQGRRCADRRRLRLGRRALHGDLGRGAGGRGDRRCAGGKTHPARRETEGRAYRPTARPITGRSSPRQHLDKVKGYIDIGIKEGAALKVDGRGFKMQGYENGFFLGGSLFDNVTKDMRIYKEEIFGPVLSVVRAKTYDEGLQLVNDHEYGNGVAIYTRDGDTARDFASRVPDRHGRHQCADPGAARLSHLRRLEALGLRRSEPARARRGALLHQDQDGDVALALRHQGRGAVLDPDDAVRGLRRGA